MKRLNFSETKRTPRYSLRKLNVGMASVLLGVTIFGINFTNHSVEAATTESVATEKVQQTTTQEETSATEQVQQTNTQKATSATEQVQQGSADTDIKSSAAKLAATVDQNNTNTQKATSATEQVQQGSADTDIKSSAAKLAATVDQNNTNTQQATSAKEKVQQNSASKNATANNSTEAATTLQSSPKTQGSADTDIRSLDIRSLTAISAAKLATMNLLAMNLVKNPGTDIKSLAARLAVTNLAAIPGTAGQNDTNPQPANENNELANKSNLTSSDNSSSNIYKGKDGKYYKIVTIYGTDYVYHVADIQASGANWRGVPKQSAEDTKNNINISKEDLGNGQTRWTVLFFPNKGLQNVGSKLSGLCNATFGIALTSDYKIVDKVNVEVISDSTQSFVAHTFKPGSSSATDITIQNPSPEVDFSFDPKRDVEPNGLINSGTMPAYNNKYLQGPYYFTTATDTGKKNLWQTYFEDGKEYYNAADETLYLGSNHDFHFNTFKIANETGVDGAKYNDPLIYDTRGGVNGVFSSGNFTQAMEFKSQGTASNPQFSSYVISFTTQHTDSHEVELTTGSKNQQFSGIAANIYSFQNDYTSKMSSLYGEQRALDAKGDPVEAKNIIDNWDEAKAANQAIDTALVNKKGEINHATNIDQATKGNLIKEATDAADVAKNAIAEATKVDAIKKAQEDGVSNINNVKVPSLEDAKKAAKDAVDQAAGKQKDLINKSNNLSDKDKQALNDQVDAAAKTAQDAITAATTNDVATKAGQDGKTAIEKVVPTSLEDAKTAANQEVKDAVDKQKALINKANNLSDKDKQALNDQVDAAAKTAQDAITAATTNDVATKAGQDGKTAIEKVVPTSLEDAKTAANQEVKDAVDKQKALINKANNLSDKDKQALNDQVDAAAKTAQDAITAATTNDVATKAGQDGKTAIEKVVPTSLEDAKTAANQEVKDAVDKQKALINKANNLSDKDKQALNDQVDAAAKTAQDAITAATTNDVATKAGQDGKTAIEKVVPTSLEDAKTAANQEVKDAVDKQKALINKANNLSDKDKQALNDQVDAAAKTAQDAITAATTNDVATKAGQDGKTAIEKVVPTSLEDAKTAANQEVKDAVDKQKALINKANNLSDKDKQALNDQVDAAAKTAQDAITAATTNDVATKAGQDGKTAIEKVVPTSLEDAKTAANQEVKDAVDKQKALINKANNLSDKDKQALNDQVDAAAKTAQDAITAATTNDVATKAGQDGKTAIEKVVPTSLEDAKTAANQEVKDAVDKQKALINKANNLSDKDKQALNDQVDAAAKTAQDAITAATTNDVATKAGQDGKTAIEKVVPTSLEDAKTAANQEVKDAVDKQKALINKANNLSDKDKQALNDQVDAAAKTAQDAITAATTNDVATKAGQDGKTAIEKVVPTSLEDAKTAANQEVKDAVDKQKALINKANNLSDKDKQALNDQVDAAAKTAQDAITAATTNDVATKAGQDGKTAIEKVVPTSLEDAKTAANQEVKDAVDKQKALINKANNLSDKDKQALNDQVDAAAKTAQDAITAATTNDVATKAGQDGKTAIEKVVPTSLEDAKTAANQEVKDAVDKQKALINKANNLSDKDKQALNDQVDAAAKTAQDAITAATTNDVATKAGQDGKTAIEKVVPTSLEDAKTAANQEVKDAVDKQKALINKANNLSDKDKQALNDQVDAAAKTAQDAITAATTNDVATKAGQDGKTAIEKVVPTSLEDAKTAANQEVKDAVDKQKALINKANNLSDKDKQALNDQVDAAAKTAQDAITAATTNDVATKAGQDGKTAIEKVVPTSLEDAKTAANQEVKDAVDKQKALINKANNLSDKDKQALNDQVDAAAKTAQDAITAATTNDVATKAGQDGKTAIEKVVPTSLEDAKTAANQEVKDAVDKQKALINKANNLSDKDKQALNDQVDAAAKTAQDAITAATTNDVATKAGQDGKTAIEKVVPTSLEDAKTAANQEVKDAVDKQKALINKANNLSDKDKQALNDQVDAAAKTAQDAITAATTNDVATKAGQDGKTAIEKVVPTSLEDAKTAANQEVKDAVDKQKALINKANNLSDKDKQALNDQVDAAAKTAQDAITAATTNDVATKAGQDGKTAIEKVVPTSLEDAKTAANQEVKDAVDKQKALINKANNLSDKDKQALNDQVDAAAKTAQDAITAATTNDVATKAGQDGKTAIEKVVPTSLEDAKTAANQEVKDAVDKQKALINKANNLSDKDKQALNDQVDAAAKTAQDAITAATTNDVATKAGQDGKTAIEKVVPTSLEDAKTAANQEVKDAVDKQKALINKANNLSDKDKQALNDQVDAAAKTAQDAITAATTNDVATKAGQDGKTAIEKVVPTSLEDAKTAANQEVKDAVDKQKALINKANNLSDKDKQALNDQVDAAAKTAQDAITAATTNDVATKAGQDGKTAIEKVVPTSLEDAKTAANQEVKDAVDKQKALINKANNLSDKDKQALNDQVDAAAKTAQDAITAATTNDVATKAGQDGKTAIEKVVPTSLEDAKTAANQEVKDAVDKQKALINKANNLSDKDKQALNDQVDAAAKTAQDAITAATTNDVATKAGQDGKTAIEKVVPTSLEDAKTAANQEVKDAVDKQKALINKANNLSDKDKQALNDQVDAAAKTAQDAITAATTNDVATKAGQDGKTAIEKVVPTSLEDAKTAANQEVKDAVDKQKALINKANNLSDKDKQALNDQVDAAAKTAQDAITAATTNDVATKAGQDGKTAIEKVVPTSLEDAKTAANQEVKDAVDKQKALINKANNLSDKDKQALNDQVDAAAKTAQDAITAATTNDVATKAGQDGKTAIEKVVPTSLEDAKTAANQEVKDAVDKQKALINKANNLSDKDKQALNDQVDAAAKTAQDAITAATTNDVATKAGQDGKTAIEKVVPTSLEDAKTAANQEVKDAVDKQKALINKANNLSDKDKQALNDQVDAAAKTAQDAITAATTNDVATKAGQDGKTAIEKVVPTSLEDAKTAANQEVKDAVDKQKALINKANNLSDKDKQALNDQVDAAAKTAQDAITAATTNDAVKTAKENGVEAINAVEIPTSSKTKNDANSDLDNTADAAKKAIDKTSGLTADQKQAAKDQIDQAVTAAKDNINKASDDTGVAAATDAGKLAIDKVSAKAAIDETLDNTKSEINGANNIDQTTKDNLIKEATAAADKAKKAIDQATTADAIKKAQDDGISNINNLNQGTDATKDNVQNSNSNGKVTNVDDQGNTTITYPDGSKNTISGDDYAYNDFYQVIVKANAVQVYTLPKGNLTKEKKLVHDTILTVLETKKIDGQVWYRIGTNRWIMAATTIKVGELENFKLKHLSKKTKTTAIVWVNKLAIYNNVNGKMTKKHLTRGTKVRIYAIATINDGEWYKIGKNKWIPAAGVHELTVEPL